MFTFPKSIQMQPFNIVAKILNKSKRILTLTVLLTSTGFAALYGTNNFVQPSRIPTTFNQSQYHFNYNSHHHPNIFPPSQQHIAQQASSPLSSSCPSINSSSPTASCSKKAVVGQYPSEYSSHNSPVVTGLTNDLKANTKSNDLAGNNSSNNYYGGQDDRALQSYSRYGHDKHSNSSAAHNGLNAKDSLAKPESHRDQIGQFSTTSYSSEIDKRTESVYSDCVEKKNFVPPNIDMANSSIPAQPFQYNSDYHRSQFHHLNRAPFNQFNSHPHFRAQHGLGNHQLLPLAYYQQRKPKIDFDNFSCPSLTAHTS